MMLNYYKKVKYIYIKLSKRFMERLNARIIQLYYKYFRKILHFIF
jgi:hypothetical protein